MIISPGSPQIELQESIVLMLNIRGQLLPKPFGYNRDRSFRRNIKAGQPP